jgi:hypothetical protein
METIRQSAAGLLDRSDRITRVMLNLERPRNPSAGGILGRSDMSPISPSKTDANRRPAVVDRKLDVRLSPATSNGPLGVAQHEKRRCDALTRIVRIKLATENFLGFKFSRRC